MSTSAQPHQSPGGAPDPGAPGASVTGGAEHPDLAGAAWRKSSHSNGAANCVEVAMLADGSVGVRHSRRPDAEVIVYSRTEWAAFVAGVKAREFEPVG
ncbi:DUF397 domain-containing protein [Catenulispora pinistramenti]|uniref:DUF397 domain-containing protein n=1 Tax=Catenulispora pinistramenti TaxID=2705254 RepID=UPI001BABA5E8|nr:DUF397 domain-containing protein [Catenulispora pinistramenti]